MYLSKFLNSLLKKEQYCKVNIEVHTTKCSDQSGPIAAIGVGNCKMLLNPFAVSDGPYAAKWGMEWILSSADLVFLAYGSVRFMC